MMDGEIGVSLGCFSYFFEEKWVFLANAANAVIVGFWIVWYKWLKLLNRE